MSMCCAAGGSELPKVKECDECEGPVDEDGYSTEICYYSPKECDKCGYAPCDLSC